MKKFWHIAGSLQTGIILLTLLLIASLIGVVFPQGLSAERYIHHWGTFIGSFILLVDLDHLFSSLWYSVLLILFSANILICTILRLQYSIKHIFSMHFPDEHKIRGMVNFVTVTKNKAVGEVTSSVAAVFKKRGFKIAYKKTEAGVCIEAKKGTLRELGSALLHFSLLPLLAGGLITSLAGFSYMQRLKPGESAPVRNRSFFVRCDYFSLERNSKGAVKDYKSGLTIESEKGDTLFRKVIEVNHPLLYKGIKMYQSSYSVDQFAIDSIKLVVTGSNIGTIGKAVTMKMNEKMIIAGTAITIQVENFIPDFMYDTKTKRAMSRSRQHNNPAIYVTMIEDRDTLFSGWVFKNFGMMHHKNNLYGVSFISYAPIQVTGLLIKENPGSVLIWCGILGMSLGVFLVFWVPRRRFWVCLKALNESETDLYAGGKVPKNNLDAAMYWEKLKNDIVQCDV